MDMDAFFAAVEQLDHPEWRGRPVIVGGSPTRRGVVAAASYEARAYGVRSAMASARAAALCPDAVWVPARFERYREMSKAVRGILTAVTPRVQPASIDEAYLDVTPGAHSNEHPAEIAQNIQERVDGLGLSCSIGVATNKTVAKIASGAAKPHGVTVVGPGGERAFLAPLPCELMPGVGKVTARRLARFGVTTIGDLAALDDVTAEDLLGARGRELRARACGTDPRPVRDNPPAKSISNERTFAEDVHTPAEVHSAIASLVDRVTGRLRASGRCGRTIVLKVRYGDLSTRTVRRTLPSPIESREPILEAALDLLEDVWSPGVGIRLLGVGVTGFETRAAQMSLLESTPERDRQREGLERAVDQVRTRFGTRALSVGLRALRQADTSRVDTPPDGPADTPHGDVR